MISFLVSALAISAIPSALCANTVTFYAVPSGPTQLAGTSPSIVPIGTGGGSDGSTTYKYNVVVTQIPVATLGSSATVDFGTGFPFGGIVGPFNVPGSPTTTLVDVPKTTLEATLIADSTRNVLSYSGPRATGTSPSYPSFIQDCVFSQDHSDGSCTYTEGTLRTGSDGQDNSNSMNQESFNGNVVPVYSAVVDGSTTTMTSGSSGMTTRPSTVTTSTSTASDGSTQPVTLTQTATGPTSVNSSSQGGAASSQGSGWRIGLCLVLGFAVAIVVM